MIRLWDFTAGREIRKFDGRVEHSSPVFSPDDKTVLTVSTDKLFRIWNVETGRTVRAFYMFMNATPIRGAELVLHGTFLPGGRRIAGWVWGRDKKLLVWDAFDGSVLQILELGADFHKDLAISPDGRYFATAHEDRSIRLRDMITGMEVQRLEMADIYVPRAVTFSRDGRLLVSGSHRGWVYLWRLTPM